MRNLLIMLLLWSASGALLAVEAVRTVDVYVLPYYAAATEPGAQPTVAVGQEMDAQLARGDAQSLAQVVARVQEAPALVTPMTLMVLAIRLYDAGQRDDAVFWFYAAKDRFLTAAQVLDFADARLAQVQDAVRNFATLAGPYFNSYAFCDLQKQQAIRARAVDWVAAHPYEVVFRDDLPALPGNRRANLKAAVDQMRSEAASEAGQLQDEDFVANFQRQRQQNGVDAQFCWQ